MFVRALNPRTHKYVWRMVRIRYLALLASFVGLGTAAAILEPVSASSSPAFVRPPLICGASGMAINGPDIWVSGCVFKTNSAFSTRIPAVFEIDSRNGAVLRVFKDHESGNDGPAGIAVADSRVWIANGDGNTVLELSATTGLQKLITKPRADGLDSPWEITASGSRVWVFNAGNNTISELNASNGSLVR